MIAEVCRAERLRVELPTADESGVDPVMERLQGFRLLAVVGDGDRMRAVIRRSGA